MFSEQQATNLGTAAPTTVVAGKQWDDSTNNIWKIRNNADNAWYSLLDMATGELLANLGDGLIVNSGDSGATASTSADDFIIEGSGATVGLSLLSTDGNRSRLVHGTPSDDFGAFLDWDFTANFYILSSARVGAKVRISGDNQVANADFSGVSGDELAKFFGDVEITDFLRTPTGGVLTNVVNEITPTANFHTFTGAAGTINTITAGTAGDRFTIYKTAGADTTVSDVAVNIKCTSNADITWSIDEALECIYDGTDWRVTQLA